MHHRSAKKAATQFGGQIDDLRVHLGTMIWQGIQHRSIRDTGALFRAQHARFLTLAMRSGCRYPRIPTKPVDSGGFSGLMKLSTGEKRAAMWWACAIDLVEDPPG